jgi:glycosyltransferase involved in cell wall biosynthesis
MRYAIVANGFAEGPAQALRDYLVERGAEVLAISHPLTPEQGNGHVIARFARGREVDTRTRRLPLRPPLSFALDPFVPLVPSPVDAWFGFNPLAAARGLLAREQRRARSVVLWSVDFAPDRFGHGTMWTRLYDHLDRLCCRRADARVELSEAARDARNRRHGLVTAAVPTHLVPMGAWLDRVPTTSPDGFEHRQIVFLGHLVERQGVDVFVDALALLNDRAERLTAAVIGDGPLAGELRERAETLGLGNVARFHGFVPNHRVVERLLAESSVAVAPYRPDKNSFTRYADPGKLKAYAAAGLPMILTDVPPNAGELERDAGAELVPFDATAVADAISRTLASPELWRERRALALAYARRFDWEALIGGLLTKLALEPRAP